MLEVSL